MNFTPRDYQQEAHDSIFEEWKSVTSTLAVAPTGCGKTVLFAMVCQSMQPKRCMVIAHREELIFQARDKIYQTTGLECGIEMANLFVNNSLFGDLPVIVSTVQTQNSAWGDRKRMGRFNPRDFGVLIIDEAHHGTAESYKTLINYYKHNNPDIKVLGVTATPDRADEIALGQVYETVAFDYEILDAIHDGWLVPVDQQFVSTTIDFSELRTTAGDLNGADLAAVMEAEDNMQRVAGSSIQIIGKRRAIVFTASVHQAEMVSSIFNRHRSGMSEWVCGTTNKDDRRGILERFKSGQTQVVCNCGVLTEGFDDPGVEVIIMGRPTKSRSLYAQMAGRSTRPLPGLVDGQPDKDARKAAIASSAKPSCLIVDFVGNSGRHKLVSSADILGGKVSEEAVARAIETAKEKGEAVRISDVLDEEEEKIQEQAAERRRQEEARKARLVAKVKFSTKQINPFDLLQIRPVTRDRCWDAGKQLSEKQKSVLLKVGVNPDDMPYAQAKQVLNEQFRRWNKKLASLKQLNVLKRFGYTDPNMEFKTASDLLTRLAGNRWKPLPKPTETV
jgi:superfamily II DNA or RNA helicase